MSHRRRALLLGGLALILGGLAASNVAGREAALARRVGNVVDVVVARVRIAAGDQVPQRALAIRRVPARFAPKDAIAAPATLAGARARIDIAPGTDLARSMFGVRDAGPDRPAIGRGERVAQVVALASPDLVTSGSRVDVLVTPEPRAGATGEAVLALEDIEVLHATALAPGAGRSGRTDGGGQVLASLRVSLRAAVYLAAAQDFARELRLLPRAPGDRVRGHAGLREGAQMP